MLTMRMIAEELYSKLSYECLSTPMVFSEMQRESVYVLTEPVDLEADPVRFFSFSR